MHEVTVIARAKAKAGCEAALERELRKVVAPTHADPGCLRYTLHRSIEDTAAFVTVERWTSKDAHDRHLGTPHVRSLFKKLPELLASSPEISLFELLPEGFPEKGVI